MPQPVAGYFRISQARDEMHAPELYTSEIERFCSYKGLELVEIFSDIDYSAFRGAKARPALEQLKSRRLEFSAVIVPKLSRFGRSVRDLVRLFELFDRDGIALTFLDMNIDTSSSQGRLLRHILAAFAEYESDVKSDYARANLRMMATEGRPHGPRAPYGYTVVGKRRDKTYVIDKQRASLVREVFDHYLAGYSLTRLARELNNRGVRGSHGGIWSRARLKSMLYNPAYAGLCRYGGETFKANWPPLISPAMFERVERLRNERRAIYGSSSGQSSHLLSGLIVCGLCKKNLTYHTTHDRQVYECRARQDRAQRCHGGQISAKIAEGLVTQARAELLALIGGGALNHRTEELETQWSDASLTERRALLSELIDAVELTARPTGNPHGRGRRPGRRLLVRWRDVWARAAFGYVGATSLLSAVEPYIVSARDKSWQQWRRLRLLGSGTIPLTAVLPSVTVIAMSAVDRNNPRRGSASESAYTIFEFDREFPDDAACLDYLVATLYPEGIYCPKCQKVTKHHREKSRPSYACQYCGHHEHPLKGTIFEGSATSLKLWFYGIYLMASTRCGISAKQLERELGVTYKTAWRMFNKIRSLLEQDDGMFEGEVEFDEAYYGGSAKWRSPARSKAAGVVPQTAADKTRMFGLAQRGREGGTGKVRVQVADGTMRYRDATEHVETKVLPATIVYTDEAPRYQDIGGMYEHKRINHSERVYVSGDVHTNTIEGFWATLKRGIGGTYHSVSTKHLQSYLDEYAFRYNNRDATGRGMFEAFLGRIEKRRPSDA